MSKLLPRVVTDIFRKGSYPKSVTLLAGFVNGSSHPKRTMNDYYALVPAVYLLQVGHRNIPPLVHALGSKPTPTCHTRNDKLRFA